MYRVTVEKGEKGKESTRLYDFKFGEVDTPEYNKSMSELADVLYGLDLNFDEEEGDMVIDDILISVADEEPFKKELHKDRMIYAVKGFEEA